MRVRAREKEGGRERGIRKEEGLEVGMDESEYIIMCIVCAGMNMYMYVQYRSNTRYKANAFAFSCLRLSPCINYV